MTKLKIETSKLLKHVSKNRGQGKENYFTNYTRF